MLNGVEKIRKHIIHRITILRKYRTCCMLNTFEAERARLRRDKQIYGALFIINMDLPDIKRGTKTTKNKSSGNQWKIFAGVLV